MSIVAEKLAMATELSKLNPEGMSIEDIYEQSTQEDTNSCTEERNDTSIVEWPYVQALFDKIDFRDNSALLTSRYYTDRYGDNAYAVLNEWLEGLGKETKDKIAKGISEEEGPDFDEAQYIGTFDRPGRFVI